MEALAEFGICSNILATRQYMAAALDSSADFFVTLDRKRFLDNDELRESTSVPIGTPGDFLDWFRFSLQYLSSSA